MKRSFRDQVNFLLSMQNLAQMVGQLAKSKKARRMTIHEFDKKVDVAIRAVFAARPRAKEPQSLDMVFPTYAGQVLAWKLFGNRNHLRKFTRFHRIAMIRLGSGRDQKL